MHSQPSMLSTDSDMPLGKVLDLLLDAICLVDRQGRYVFVSAAFERIFGYAPEEVVGRPMIDLVHPDDRERTLLAAREIMADKPQPHFRNRYLRKDGGVVHVLWSARWSAADGMRIAVAHDITELKRAESMQAALHEISEAAHQAEDLLALFRQIHLIVGKLLPAMNFFVALYDEKRDELSFPYFVDQYDTPPAARPLNSGTLSAEVIRSGQALLLTPDSRPNLPEWIQAIVGRDSLDWLGVPLVTPKGVIGALVVQSYSGEVRYNEKDKALLQFVCTQIGAAIQRKQAETWLQYIALHDTLTNLPNRELLHDRLRTALAMARRDNQQLALLYIDLDHFKQVNDRLGHDIGDRLLQQAAERLSRCVRKSDTVGRVGGDEFVVLLHGPGLAEHVSEIAQKILDSLAGTFELAGKQLQIACSIGIALYPEHGNDDRQLLRRADAAMYEAKRRGGNQMAVAALSTGSDDDPLPGCAW